MPEDTEGQPGRVQNEEEQLGALLMRVAMGNASIQHMYIYIFSLFSFLFFFFKIQPLASWKHVG